MMIEVARGCGAFQVPNARSEVNVGSCQVLGGVPRPVMREMQPRHYSIVPVLSIVLGDAVVNLPGRWSIEVGGFDVVGRDDDGTVLGLL